MGPKPKKNSPTRSKSPNKVQNDPSFFTANLNDVKCSNSVFLFYK